MAPSGNFKQCIWQFAGNNAPHLTEKVINTSDYHQQDTCELRARTYKSRLYIGWLSWKKPKVSWNFKLKKIHKHRKEAKWLWIRLIAGRVGCMLNANTLICSGITTDFPDSSPDDNCLVALFGTIHFALAFVLALSWVERDVASLVLLYLSS